MNTLSTDFIIKAAISEDLCPDFRKGLGVFLTGKKPEFSDVTTEAIFRKEEGSAKLVAKSEGVLSGSVPFRRVYEIIDPAISVEFFKVDGDVFAKSENVAELKGQVRSVLMGERTALNFLGHLSGIATAVRELVRVLEGSGIKLLDTRKTVPGMRELEKKAVAHGGGMNHRMGLFDMVLIKDNHIDFAGSIQEAVRKVRNLNRDRFKIEVETRSLEEVRLAVASGADRIMLDNMNLKEIQTAVKIINRQAEIEVSGNMDREKIKGLRGIKVDYISAGYITNAAGHSDFSLLIQ
jgi:nicotinate-nucleotide pyrophosphorylase (carboxylating)